MSEVHSAPTDAATGTKAGAKLSGKGTNRPEFHPGPPPAPQPNPGQGAPPGGAPQPLPAVQQAGQFAIVTSGNYFVTAVGGGNETTDVLRTSVKNPSTEEKFTFDQFLRTGSNQRTDDYGGVASNRVRFLAEVVERVLQLWDRGQVGVRLSPTGGFNDMRDENPHETFSVAVTTLNRYKLGYLHVVETAQNSKGSSEEDLAMSALLRSLWLGFYIVNGGYDRVRGEQAIKTGRADAVAYGRAFLANPDLPRRLRLGAALNEADQRTFYGGDATGYTSYPALAE